jgi:cobalamin biosynthesis protein CbiG
MQIFLPGYNEESRLYEMAINRSDGSISIWQSGEFYQKTIHEIAEKLDKDQFILLDSGEKQVIDELRRLGFHVVEGRL